MKNKLLVICGPTAVGKTNLAVKIAKQFNGEIISADSRQVYKFMDIGTGKDIQNSKFKIQNSKLQAKIKEETKTNIAVGTYRIKKASIWGLDLVNPDQLFSVAHWLKFSHYVIEDIWRRKKLALIVGGTGFWIKALINGFDSVNIPPNWQIRKQLENFSVKKLQIILKKISPKKLLLMNNSDKNNPRRLIRAIEIRQAKTKEQKFSQKVVIATKCETLKVGLKASNKFLYQKIDERVKQRIKRGMEKEIRNLLKKGYKWNFPSMSALGYKEWQPFFQKKASLAEVIQRWQFNEHGYARRQIVWFKKDKEIKWFTVEKKNYFKKVVKLIKNWYYKNNGKN